MKNLPPDPGYEENSSYEGYRSSSYLPRNAGTSTRSIKAYHEIKYKLEEELVEYISKRAKECGLCDSAYLSRLIKRDMGFYEKVLPGSPLIDPEGENERTDIPKEENIPDPGIIYPEEQIYEEPNDLPDDLAGNMVITETGRKFKKRRAAKTYIISSRKISTESKNEELGFM